VPLDRKFQGLQEAASILPIVGKTFEPISRTSDVKGLVAGEFEQSAHNPRLFLEVDAPRVDALDEPVPDEKVPFGAAGPDDGFLEVLSAPP
jgi:hypothetical protein